MQSTCCVAHHQDAERSEVRGPVVHLNSVSRRRQVMKKVLFATASVLVPFIASDATATARAQGASAPATMTLPRPDFHFQGQVGRTYQDSDPATFPHVVRPPKGAPNIVVLLLDDVGFGQFIAF